MNSFYCRMGRETVDFSIFVIFLKDLWFMSVLQEWNSGVGIPVGQSFYSIAIMLC